MLPTQFTNKSSKDEYLRKISKLNESKKKDQEKNQHKNVFNFNTINIVGN